MEHLGNVPPALEKRKLLALHFQTASNNNGQKKKGEKKKDPNFTCPTPAFFNFPVEKARTTQLLQVVSSEGSGFGKQLLKTKR